MKRILAVVLLMFAGNTMAQGTIDGSAHDFVDDTTFQATGTGADEICAYCHTPHNSLANASPIWNKTALTTTSYTAYGTTVAGTTIDNSGVPTGTTQLCLGCHDGTVAPGTVSNPPNRGWTDGGTAISSGNSTAFMGDSTFANDHPVGFDYTTSVAVTAGDIIDLAAAETAGFPMDGNNMTCATCHNVHNESGADTLLVTSNVASAMCQACHGK